MRRQPDSTPGFFRRFAAACYDSLLLLAIWFLATALILPLNGGNAFEPGQYLYSGYLFLVSAAFFIGFWTFGGQTLGLRAWKMRIYRFDGGKVCWKLASLRFLAACLSFACLGLGFLWCLIDKNRLCWHDYLSGTSPCLIDREKPADML